MSFYRINNFTLSSSGIKKESSRMKSPITSENLLEKLVSIPLSFKKLSNKILKCTNFKIISL